MTSCNSSDEMHHNRHKNILRIVRQITTLDNDQVGSLLTPSKFDSNGKKRRDSVGTVTDTTSESTGMDDAKQTRRERKKLKKAGNSNTKLRREVESFPKEELDFVSEAIHLSIHESKGAWEGTYVYDHKKDSVNTLDRTNMEETVTFEYDMTSSSVDDLVVKLPDNLTPRQRRTLKKYSTPINHSSYGGGSKKYSPNALNPGAADPFDGVDPAVFFRLGIEVVNPVKNSKARKDLIVKLIAAIRDDLDVIYREDMETDMREEGFWRWAGKTAMHVMKETRKTLDWATGQKINEPQAEEFMSENDEPGFKEVDSEDSLGSDDKVSNVPRLKREASVEEPMPLSPKFPNWKTVTASKKAQLPKKKAKKMTMSFASFVGASKPFEPVQEEEGGEDFNEMITRYQQTRAGERNIGRGGANETDQRRGGRMWLK